MGYSLRKRPSRKNTSRKRPSRKRPTRKTKRRVISNPKLKRRYKGGGTSSTSTTSAVPVQSYPLQPGATSQRDSAMISGQNMNSKQQSLVDTHGGATRKKRRKRYYGGSCSVPSDPVTVPTFSNSGSTTSPVNSNSNSALSNSTSMQSSANACNDCYATGTCSGGRKTTILTWSDAFPTGDYGYSLTG